MPSRPPTCEVGSRSTAQAATVSLDHRGPHVFTFARVTSRVHGDFLKTSRRPRPRQQLDLLTRTHESCRARLRLPAPAAVPVLAPVPVAVPVPTRAVRIEMAQSYQLQCCGWQQQQHARAARPWQAPAAVSELAPVAAARLQLGQAQSPSARWRLTSRRAHPRQPGVGSTSPPASTGR